MGIEPFQTKNQTEKNNNNKNTHSNSNKMEEPSLGLRLRFLRYIRICHVVYPVLDFPFLFV